MNLGCSLLLFLRTVVVAGGPRGGLCTSRLGGNRGRFVKMGYSLRILNLPLLFKL